MAKQRGSIILQGSIGNISFFKSGDGYLVRGKGGASAQRIATDKAFQRTRENMAEFGRAATSARLLRTSLSSTIVNARDTHMVSRLTSRMLGVVQADTISDKGHRHATAANARLLEGFEFNKDATLPATLSAPYTLSFTPSAGNVVLRIADFIPVELLAAPAGTTHFQVFAAAASVSFGGNSFEADTATTAALAYNNKATGALTLPMALPSNSTYPVFIVLGVGFLQQVNADKYSLYNSAFNACSIIKVYTPA
jgi:hypothetical protein